MENEERQYERRPSDGELVAKTIIKIITLIVLGILISKAINAFVGNRMYLDNNSIQTMNDSIQNTKNELDYIQKMAEKNYSFLNKGMTDFQNNINKELETVKNNINNMVQNKQSSDDEPYKFKRREVKIYYKEQLVETLITTKPLPFENNGMSFETNEGNIRKNIYFYNDYRVELTSNLKE